MKHDLPVTLILVGVFLLAQVVGLAITNSYYDPVKSTEEGKIVFEELPSIAGYQFERPEPTTGASSIIFLIVAVLLGTGLMLLLMKWNANVFIKLWFLFAIALTSVFALAAFMAPSLAAIVGIGLAIWRIYRPNVIVQNVTEIFLYGGLAAIFVPFLKSIAVASIILILISIYDAYAVWKSRHMVKLAEYQSKSGVFAGLLIPYNKKIIKKKSKKATVKKVKATSQAKTTSRSSKKLLGRAAVLGGGDIGFPLLFSGVVLTQVGFAMTLIITASVTIALALLLWKSKENRYYPAMPFLSAGCFVGYGIIWLLSFL